MNHNLIYCPEDFIKNAPRVIFKKGEYIVKSNTYPHYVYVVISGTANITYLSSKGKTIIASQFLKGDFIGEMNAICSQKYIFDAIALTDMELLKIPAEEFIQKMQTDFRLVQSMVQSQNNRINYIEAFSIINSTFTLYERILLFLCCFLLRDDERHSFDKNFLVSYTGSDLRCVNRVLKEMSSKNLIVSKRGTITIPDHNKLLEEAKKLEIDYQIEFFYNFIVDGLYPFSL